MSQRLRVGELRPSQILFTYGIGAVVDLPNISTMVMGIDFWDVHQARELDEERLLQAVRNRLGFQVTALRTAPTPPPGEDRPELSRIGVPVASFPQWFVCPRCRLLAPLSSRLFRLKEDSFRPENNRYIHENCSQSQYPVTAVPARFLVACSSGHLDDFPWSYFVHRGNTECRGALRLSEYGVSGSASDVLVSCPTCNISRPMSDAFGEMGGRIMPRCRGRHPHLSCFEDCSQQMRAILLGASNSWFPITLSALSIPTGTNRLEQLLTQRWTELGKVTSLEILKYLRSTGGIREFNDFTDAQIWEAIERKQQASDAEQSPPEDLKIPEWRVFTAADRNGATRDFKLSPVDAPSGYEQYFQKVVLVEKLREVRALVGFTRLESPGESTPEEETEIQAAPLSRNAPHWVPAAEVRGEGIFIEFKQSAIDQWFAANPALKEYEKQNLRAHCQWRLVRSLEPPEAHYPGVQFILLHSFAHALMRQLAIECGYTAASLRERIYCHRPEENAEPMAGILIYTAAPDSEGTLGGLVNLGSPGILGRHIDQALEQMGLCASDPLCAEHNPLADTTSLHWAACHACLFSPETSCEKGNRYLDRSLLVPTVKDSQLAFFKELS